MKDYNEKLRIECLISKELNKKNPSIKQLEKYKKIYTEGLIVPIKKNNELMVSPESFKEQFGFYPYENHDELVLYDLSNIDYSDCDLSNRDFNNTTFCFDISKLKNKIVVNSNFENCNLEYAKTDGLFIANDNFDGTFLNVDISKLQTRYLTNETLLELSLNEIDGFISVLSKGNYRPKVKDLVDGIITKEGSIIIDYDKVNEEKDSSNFIQIYTRSLKGTHLSQVSFCKFSTCLIKNASKIIDFLGLELPMNNFDISFSNQETFYSFNSNGARLNGEIRKADVRNANIKNSGALIYQDEVRRGQMTNGNYEGCLFNGTSFEGINKENSSFDKKIKTFGKVK